VIVNTVVLVRTEYARPETDVAYALAAFGAGSMIAALALPRLLERVADRAVMLPSALGLAALTLAHALWLMVAGLAPWPAFLLLWAASGLLYAAILTPSGRLLRRSANPEDRPAVFAAQFALSHACWLVTYPLAGWAGEALGLPATMASLAAVALFGAGAAALLWPAIDAVELVHAHPDLPMGHPHLGGRGGGGSREHGHRYVIDDLHPAWPARPGS
jgi:MFS family permease